MMGVEIHVRDTPNSVHCKSSLLKKDCILGSVLTLSVNPGLEQGVLPQATVLLGWSCVLSKEYLPVKERES